MSSAKKILASFLVSHGAVHNIGDSAVWASSKNFHVGNNLVFNYNNQSHNVKQVTLQDFLSCNGASPIATFATRSDSITLKRAGHYYFLCGYPGHCEAGQKLDIEVTQTSLRPITASPTPSLGSSSFLAPSSNGSSSASSLQSLKLWSALVTVAIFGVGFAF